MDDVHRTMVHQMRSHVVPISRIAGHLFISVNTVKTLCRRQHWHPDDSLDQVADPRGIWCRNCGKQISVGMGMRRPWFCSNQCRRAWWKTHPEATKRSAFYQFTCAGCSQSFTAYGNRNRKYCSHECYIRHRFHKSGDGS